MRLLGGEGGGMREAGSRLRDPQAESHIMAGTGALVGYQ